MTSCSSSKLCRWHLNKKSAGTHFVCVSFLCQPVSPGRVCLLSHAVIVFAYVLLAYVIIARVYYNRDCVYVRGASASSAGCRLGEPVRPVFDPSSAPGVSACLPSVFAFTARVCYPFCVLGGILFYGRPCGGHPLRAHTGAHFFIFRLLTEPPC